MLAEQRKLTDEINHLIHQQRQFETWGIPFSHCEFRLMLWADVASSKDRPNLKYPLSVSG